MINRIALKLAKMAEKGYEFEGRESINTLLSGLGLSEETIDNIYLELKNKMAKDRFMETKVSDRVLLLPHCIRDPEECEAKNVEWGLQCNACGRCSLGGLTEIAEKLGYDYFIVPGGSMVKKIAEEKNYSASIGVACFPELIDANRYLEKNGVNMLMVKLEEDGCFDTEVDVGKVKEKMLLGIRYKG